MITKTPSKELSNMITSA